MNAFRDYSSFKYEKRRILAIAMEFKKLATKFCDLQSSGIVWHACILQRIHVQFLNTKEEQLQSMPWNSSPSPYCWPFPDFQKLRSSLRWKSQSSIIIPSVGIFSKLLLGFLNKLNVHNIEILHRAVEKREKNVSLITFSNHYSCADDPILWGILNWKTLFSPGKMRWSLAAHDICFTKQCHSQFFGSGKCIPIIRGNGVYQKAMDFCVDLLNQGQWIHVFPEGLVNIQKGHLRFKWGIGRLIAECNIPPIVIPLFHVGMDSLLPNKKPYFPHFQKKITVCVGNALDMSEVCSKQMRLKLCPTKHRKYITDFLQEEFYKLRRKTEQYHQNVQVYCNGIS